MTMPLSRNTAYASGTPIKSQDLNDVQNYLAEVYTRRGSVCFGDGSDGVVALDGVVGAPAWATKSGSVYSLSRDAYLEQVTVQAGVQLNTNGFRLFCRGQLITVGGGIVHCNGAAAAGQFPAAQGNIGTVLTGAAGGAAAGGAGGVQLLAAGGAGGSGSNVTVGDLANGGTISTDASTQVQNPGLRVYSPQLFGYLVGAGFGSPFASQMAYLSPFGGGAGGGGGGAGGTAGAGGAGGGILPIAAAWLNLSSATDLQCKGGAGGAGGPGSGGGGGGGGVMLLAYAVMTINGVLQADASALSAAVNCAGGAAGIGSSGHVNGVAGSNGRLFAIQLR